MLLRLPHPPQQLLDDSTTGDPQDCNCQEPHSEPLPLHEARELPAWPHHRDSRTTVSPSPTACALRRRDEPCQMPFAQTHGSTQHRPLTRSQANALAAGANGYDEGRPYVFIHRHTRIVQHAVCPQQNPVRRPLPPSWARVPYVLCVECDCTAYV